MEDLPADLRGTSTARADPLLSEGQDGEAWTSETSFQEAKARAVESFERRFLTAALRRAGGNVSQAARDTGIHRQNLQKKLSQLGIDPSRV